MSAVPIGNIRKSSAAIRILHNNNDDGMLNNDDENNDNANTKQDATSDCTLILQASLSRGEGTRRCYNIFKGLASYFRSFNLFFS